MTSMEFEYAGMHLKIHYLIFSLQESILGQILLHIFINDLDKGAGHTLSGFAAVTKVGVLIDTPDACAAISWHVNRPEIVASRNLLKQSKGEMPSPAFGEEETPGTHLYRLGGVWLESSFAVKALRVLMDVKWNMSQ